MVLKYERNGSLAKMLMEHPILTVDCASGITVDILLAVKYLHRKKIIHGDLKPANILLNTSYRAIVTDFGLCKIDSEKNTGHWGTREYQSPEQLTEGEEWDSKVDIFAIGVIFIEMVAGSHPFQVIGNIQKTVDNIKKITFEIPYMLQPTAISFLHLTVCQKTSRMNVQNTVQHQFIKGKVASAAVTFTCSPKIIMNEEFVNGALFQHLCQ